MNAVKVIKYCLIPVLFLSIKSFAQYGSIGSVDARSMGFAKTYTAVSVGVHALGLNPANLIIEDTLKYQVATVFPLPTISAITGSDVLSLNDLNYFFGGINGSSRYLNELDKQRLNYLFESGGFFFANASAQLFSISYMPDKKIGAFGFSISDYSGGKLKVPSALIDLVLNGNPVNKVFDMSDAEVHTWWIRNYSISYARKFDDLDIGIFKNLIAGISFKLVHGFAYASTGLVNINLATSGRNELSSQSDFLAYTSFSDNFGVQYDFDSTKRSSNFKLFPAPAGTGFGVDFGLTYLLNKDIIVSAAVTDIGSITWRRNTARFTGNADLFIDDLTDQAKLDSLLDEIKTSTEPAGKFSTVLPSAIRFGVAIKLSEFDEGNLPGHLLIAADLNKGFNNMPGNSTRPRYSIGVEWGFLDFLPMIRTGVEYSDVSGFNWAFGLGFVTSLLEVSLATNSLQTTFFPRSYSTISLSLSSRWKFY